MYAGPGCKDDRDIVLAAVQQFGEALEFAGPGLKDDREVVLAAVRERGAALMHAGEICRDNKEIVLAAVQQNAESIYGSEGCKNDTESHFSHFLVSPTIYHVLNFILSLNPT